MASFAQYNISTVDVDRKAALTDTREIAEELRTHTSQVKLMDRELFVVGNDDKISEQAVPPQFIVFARLEDL
jgi:hypothetical protein